MRGSQSWFRLLTNVWFNSGYSPMLTSNDSRTWTFPCFKALTMSLTCYPRLFRSSNVYKGNSSWMKRVMSQKDSAETPPPPILGDFIPRLGLSQKSAGPHHTRFQTLFLAAAPTPWLPWQPPTKSCGENLRTTSQIPSNSLSYVRNFSATTQPASSLHKDTAAFPEYSFVQVETRGHPINLKHDPIGSIEPRVRKSWASHLCS